MVTAYGISPKVTVVILFFGGATLGFHLNRRITFTDKLVGVRMLGKYLVISTTLMFVGQLMHLVLTDIIGIPHQITQAVSMLALGVVSFVINRKLTFR